MTRERATILVSVAVIAAAGLGVGVGIAATSGGTPAPAASTASSPYGPGYAYYRNMMGRYFGGTSMMGGGYGWMMGATGYRWMFGGTSAPAWMRGEQLPAAMMGTAADPGKIMGRLWADAPGPRVRPAQAIALASQVPAGARIDQAANTITFTTHNVHLAAVASPAGGPDETFRIAGMVNPAITVAAGATVSIQVINADTGTAHGLVITAGSGQSSWMPMMTNRTAFPGSALWFLGNPTGAGMHAGTLTFTATTPGTFHYLCPVPGHAQKGMTGLFSVSNTG
jgi:rusticyanin